MTWFLRTTTTYLRVYCIWCVLYKLGMSEAGAHLFTQTCCRFIKSEPGTCFPLVFALKLSASSGCNCRCWSRWEPLPCRSTWCKRHRRCASLQQGPQYICQDLSLSETSLSPLSIPFQPECSGKGPLSVFLAPANGCTPGI